MNAKVHISMYCTFTKRIRAIFHRIKCYDFTLRYSPQLTRAGQTLKHQARASSARDLLVGEKLPNMEHFSLADTQQRHRACSRHHTLRIPSIFVGCPPYICRPSNSSTPTWSSKPTAPPSLYFPMYCQQRGGIDCGIYLHTSVKRLHWCAQNVALTGDLV